MSAPVSLDEQLESEQPQCADFADPRLHVHRQFHSHHLPGARDVAVYLPTGYESDTDQSYPVLYMHDGQKLFGVEGSWQVRQHADAAIEAGEVQPLIIVGICSANDRRIAEYTHVHDPERGGGEAEAYGRFIVDELMPWVAARYRVRADRDSIGMAGSSLGGLVTLYLGLRHPERFGRLGVLSPSAWWGHMNILQVVTERTAHMRGRPHMWLDVGRQEGRRSIREVEELARTLEAHGWVPGSTLHFQRISNSTHDEASWARRVRPMLRYLYPVERD